MNLDKLFSWIVPVVIAAAVLGNLESLQRWIWTMQAKTIAASKTSTWGSPRFFPTQPSTGNGQTRLHAPLPLRDGVQESKMRNTIAEVPNEN